MDQGTHTGGTGVPSYEGRRLPRPGEELVDQGLAFDVGTLLNRRRLLQVLGPRVPGGGAGGPGAAGGPGSDAGSPGGSPPTGPVN
jgi:hypothetical protein